MSSPLVPKADSGVEVDQFAVSTGMCEIYIWVQYKDFILTSISIVQLQNWGRTRDFNIIHKLRSLWTRKHKLTEVLIEVLIYSYCSTQTISIHLQHSENSVLTCQHRDNAAQVLSRQAHNVINFVSRQVVVLILAVTVVVVDVTRTHKKVCSWNVPEKHIVGIKKKTHCNIKQHKNTPTIPLIYKPNKECSKSL